MATQFPYLLVLPVVLTSGGTGTGQYTVPANEMLELNQLFIASTGVFSITDIRDSSGQHYTNAAPSQPIPSTLLSAAGNGYNVFKDFPAPIIVQGGKIISIDLIDTSGAGNTVRLFLPGKRILT